MARPTRPVMEWPVPGQAVRFSLGDLFCLPGDRALLELLEAVLSLTVTGRVAFIAGPGRDPGRYAAIDVDGLQRRLIVAVDRLEAATAEPTLAATGHSREA